MRDPDQPMLSSLKPDPNCIFCKILVGEIEASIIFQDEYVTALMDLYPVTPGHALVIPNQHAALIFELEPKSIDRMFGLGARLDQAMRRSGIQCEAVSLFLADGAAAGQAVYHSHLHVIPRFRGDSCGLRLHANPVELAPRATLDEHARTLRRSLELQDHHGDRGAGN